MEIGILVAAAVAVAAIAAYYYATNVKSSADSAGTAATNTISTLGQSANKYANSLSVV